MFEEVLKDAKKVTEGDLRKLYEGNSGIYASTDIRPQPSDVTIAAWLYRISQWGPLTITHYNPESKIKRVITQDEFIQKVSDPELNKLFGTWDGDRLDIDKAVWFRDYVGLDGKKYQEKFTIEVDLSAIEGFKEKDNWLLKTAKKFLGLK